MDKILIGHQLRELLHVLGITKAELSRRIQCSTGYLSDVESDKKSPGVDLLAALYREYGANIHYMLTGKGQMFVHGSDPKQDPDTESDRRVIELEAQLAMCREIIRDLAPGKEPASSYAAGAKRTRTVGHGA